MTDERMARMGLASVHDAGDARLHALVGREGAVEVWDHLRSGHGNTAMSRRAAMVDLSDVVKRTQAVGARFVIPGDQEWPVSVEDLSWSDPVGGFGGAPLGLWVIGKNLAESSPSVAVVGSRASTTYGEHVAADWGAGLTERGWTVVSGGAYGIDACAHRGAIAGGGLTIAVMAGGLAQLYPPGNTALLRKVCEVGTVISEFAPDCPPSRARFLVRNRLIAALSQGTLIVEGGMRSGAQNTVSWALSMQRVVMATPGPITSALSVTPHRLIRSGEAILVSSVDEVISALGPADTSIPDYPLQQPTLFDTLTPTQQAVYESMPGRGGISMDELCVLTGETALTLLAVLAQLTQASLITEAAPGTWKLTHRS